MKVVAVAAAVEVAAGVILAVIPSVAARLVFGTDFTPAGTAICRIAGFGLLGLGIACWPASALVNPRAVRGLLAYNVLAAVFFAWLGISRELVGPLLWPAAALHGVLSLLLARDLIVSKTT
jgi:hypothetical protein